MAYKLIDDRPGPLARRQRPPTPGSPGPCRCGLPQKGKLLERPTDITPPTPSSEGGRHTGTEVA